MADIPSFFGKTVDLERGLIVNFKRPAGRSHSRFSELNSKILR